MSGDYATMQVGLDELRIEKHALAQLLWASVPAAIKDPHSAEALKHRASLVVLDGILLTFGPKILKGLFGGAISMPKGEDRIRWYMQLFVRVAAEASALQALDLDVAEAVPNERQGITYTIRGVTAVSAQREAPEAITAGASEGDEHPDSSVESAIVTRSEDPCIATG